MTVPLDILGLLPHGPSFVMVSRVVSHRPGELATSKEWALSDGVIEDHFPKGPKVVPGVLIAEQAAQSAFLLAILDGLAAPNEVFFLASSRCEFLAPALAPCSVIAQTEFTAVVGGRIGFQSRCSVREQIVARIKGIASPPLRGAMVS